MPEDINEAIRKLSKIYDKDSMDSFVSLYLNADGNIDKKFVERRERACISVLKDGEQKNFINTMKEIKKLLKSEKWKNIAIFASYKNNFLEYIKIPVKLDNTLIVDSSPYLRPVARIQDEWESFTLLLISSDYAKIVSVTLGRIEQTKTLSANIMNKHKKGGWSQARFNRLRKGVIHSFHKDVLEALQKVSDKQIIIAGPGTAKNQFIDMMPKTLLNRVIDVVDVNVHDEKELLEESIQLVQSKEQREGYERIKHLKSEILKDGLAAYGVKETLSAVKNGQVEILFIQKNFKIPGWICEHCQIVEKGYKEHCPVCGRNTSKVDVIEEILEFAERTDAEIEFTDDKELANLGHVAAILRYK